MAGPIYFAIGDVHGEADKLRALHDTILERIAFERAPATIVHLGDYVDRGPDSRGVIERVLKLEQFAAGNPNLKVVSLMGNHEQMMLDAFMAEGDEDQGWLSQGGLETLDSYAGAHLKTHTGWRTLIPKDHLDWMSRLPVIFRDPARGLVFVHAGIEPAAFPQEGARTYLWTRSDRFFVGSNWPDREELKGLTVVHGHTPKSYDPEVFPHRINIDTGAVFGGPLTAVMLKEGASPEFLRAF